MSMDDSFYEDMEFELDDECPHCEEGYNYSCIHGCCENAEEGCDLCRIRCQYCNNPRRLAEDDVGR
jgi:hypothetical protein